MLNNLTHNRSFYNPFAHFSADEQMLINIFLASASMDVLQHWIVSNRKVPVERAIQLTGELLEKGVSSLLKTDESVRLNSSDNDSTV